MSTENIREKLRNLREINKLPLRKVAAMADIDVAILSKMERGERKLTRDIVLKLADIYNYDPRELMILFLSDRVVYDIGNEDLALEALQVAEKQIKYRKKGMKDEH